MPHAAYATKPLTATWTKPWTKNDAVTLRRPRRCRTSNRSAIRVSMAKENSGNINYSNQPGRRIHTDITETYLQCVECAALYIIEPEELEGAPRIVGCSKCLHEWYACEDDLLWGEDEALAALGRRDKVSLKKRRGIPEEEIEEDDEGINIFVGNLSFRATEEDLYRAFSGYGYVLKCQVPSDESGASRGFGFVEMKCRKSGINAIDALQGVSVCGRDINVSEARTRKQQRSTYSKRFGQKFRTDRSTAERDSNRNGADQDSAHENDNQPEDAEMSNRSANGENAQETAARQEQISSQGRRRTSLSKAQDTTNASLKIDNVRDRSKQSESADAKDNDMERTGSKRISQNGDSDPSEGNGKDSDNHEPVEVMDGMSSNFDPESVATDSGNVRKVAMKGSKSRRGRSRLRKKKAERRAASTHVKGSHA